MYYCSSFRSLIFIKVLNIPPVRKLHCNPGDENTFLALLSKHETAIAAKIVTAPLRIYKVRRSQ